MPHSVWTHTSGLYSRNERSINIPAAGDSSRENWGVFTSSIWCRKPICQGTIKDCVQQRVKATVRPKEQRHDLRGGFSVAETSATKINTLLQSQTTDEKDTAPSRRAHTPPLWRSPQDMRAFPAVPHRDLAPLSCWRYYPDGHRPKTNVMI